MPKKVGQPANHHRPKLAMVLGSAYHSQHAIRCLSMSNYLSQRVEAFVTFSSQDIPSQSLGFVDSQATEVTVVINNRELNIRQSRGLLTSDRKQGTTGAGGHRLIDRPYAR